MTREELIHEVHRIIWTDNGGNELHGWSFIEDCESSPNGYDVLAGSIVDFFLNYLDHREVIS